MEQAKKSCRITPRIEPNDALYIMGILHIQPPAGVALHTRLGTTEFHSGAIDIQPLSRFYTILVAGVAMKRNGNEFYNSTRQVLRIISDTQCTKLGGA